MKKLTKILLVALHQHNLNNAVQIQTFQ